jgi:hypothetical protein
MGAKYKICLKANHHSRIVAAMIIHFIPHIENTFAGAMSAEADLRAWLSLPLRFLP